MIEYSKKIFESSEDALNKIFWVPGAISEISGMIGQVFILGGFNRNPELGRKWDEIKKGTDGDGISSIESYVNSLIDFISTLKEIRPKDYQIELEPVAVSLSTAVDKLFDASTYLETVIKSAQKELGASVGKKATGKKIGSFISRVSSNINKLGGSLYSGTNPNESLSNAKIAYVSFLNSIENLKETIEANLNDRNSEDSEDILRSIKSIQSRVEGAIKTLSSGEKLSPNDSRKVFSNLEEYKRDFNVIRKRYYDDILKISKSSSPSESFEAILKEAQDKIDRAVSMVNSQKEGTKIFKGLPRLELDDRVDQAIEDIRDKERESQESEAEENKETREETNKKKINVTVDGGSFLDRDPGDYVVDYDRLEALLKD